MGLKVFKECCKNCLLSEDRIVSAKRAEEFLNEKFADNLPGEFEGEIWDEKLISAMKEYATEAVKEALEKASENGDVICGNKKKHCTQCGRGGCEMPIVDKESILDTKIDLP